MSFQQQDLSSRYISGYKRCQTCINLLRHAWPAAVTVVMTGKYCDQPLLHPSISQCLCAFKKETLHGNATILSHHLEMTSVSVRDTQAEDRLLHHPMLPKEHLEGKPTLLKQPRHCVTSAASFAATLCPRACCVTPQLRPAMVIWAQVSFSMLQIRRNSKPVISFCGFVDVRRASPRHMTMLRDIGI
ncbi:hypothetical protein V8C26DRAFT_404585 [Trichoderma gracile]